METDTVSASRAFNGYQPPRTVYDEAIDSQGRLRPHWQPFVSGMSAEAAPELIRRAKHANRLIHENGITYNAFNDTYGGRPWEVDLLPLVITAEEWKAIGDGIAQRATLLSLILDDLYGPQELLASGDLPAEVVFAHSGFHRPFCNLPIPLDKRLLFFGCELARSPDGKWWAMADRTEGPAGAGYALENRIVVSRIWPKLIRDCQVRRLAPFFMRLQQSLAALTPRATENPRIVLLTAGPTDPSYFEDVYLARYLGYTLVEGGDLAVRNDCVFIKTLDGLIQIDVILSRISESELDPLELRTSSAQGIAGLLQSIRTKNVAVANSPGAGFVESPVIMAFLPKLCQRLLGQQLKLPSIATWWCGNPTSRKYVFDNLSKLVIKPAFEHSGGAEVFGDRLTQNEADELKARISTAPSEYIAQERITRSSTPVWTPQNWESSHVALRTFAARHRDQYEVMPGALVRVATSSGPMELSIAAGDGSKDAWIIADGPVDGASLLPTPDAALRLRRNSPQLPSRVADNLFWLGRHLDRAEISARLLRVIVDRLSGEQIAGDIPELVSLIQVLAAAGQIEPDYAIDGLNRLQPNLEHRLPASIFDSNEAHSLRSTVSEIARLASIVRDRLSQDTWRVINRMDEDFYPKGAPESLALDETLTLIDQLVIDLAVCGGLLNDGMVRGPAWRFLDLGRRIERTQLTAELLLELIRDGQQPTTETLNAILDVMDLQVTYRARYLAAIRVAPILDLLIADDSNPRSLLFQVNEIQRHVDTLPKDPAHVGLTDEEKAVSEVVHHLQMLDVSRQLGPQQGSDVESKASVAEELQIVVRAMEQLSGSLASKYLVHSGTPRKIQDEPAMPR